MNCSSNPDNASTRDGWPELSAFARSFSQRAPRLAWFLGAGASAQSFVPTADQLVDVLLRQIYCTERGVPVDSLDLGDRHDRRLLRQVYSGQQGLPHDDDPRFYAEVFERALPNPEDRADFLESRLRGAIPNYGHHVLAALVAANSLRLVVTSNFDPLIERAINPVLDAEFFDGRQLEIADLDSPDKAPRALAIDRWPLLVKIHGDYRSERLKNASSELREQDSKLRRMITSALARFGLVVVGYSGRDESVMRMFRDVLASPTPFPAGLVWVKRPQDRLAESVVSLLSDARSAGVATSIVTASSFVDLATRLEHAISMPKSVRRWLSARAQPRIRRAEPAPASPTGTAPILQLNALPVLQLPCEVRSLAWTRNPIPLDRLRDALRRPEHDALAGILSGNPVAFGPDSILRSRLSNVGVRVTDSCRSLNLGACTSDAVDTQALGLVTEALVVGLARHCGLRPILRRRSSHLIRVIQNRDAQHSPLRHACRGPIHGVIHHHASGLRFPWAEAISVNLERRRGQWWLLLNPEIWTPPRPIEQHPSSPPATHDVDAIFDQRKEFIRDRSARRYNSQMGEIILAWLDTLTGGYQTHIRAFDIRSGEGVDAEFTLGGNAATSLPLLHTKGDMK